MVTTNGDGKGVVIVEEYSVVTEESGVSKSTRHLRSSRYCMWSVGAEQQLSTSSQALDLSFLAGLNPELYQSIGHSLGIFNNGQLRLFCCLSHSYIQACYIFSL